MNDRDQPSGHDHLNRLYSAMFDATRSAKRRNSLMVLKKILDAELASKNPDFSVSRIAALSKSYGGPAEQSIRNATGADLRALIDAYSKASNWRSSGRLTENRTERASLARLLESVSDPQVRAEITMVYAENRSLKRQIDILRSNTSNGMIISLNGDGTVAPTETLDDVEKDAITDFVSSRNFEDHDWHEGPDGRLLTSNGRQVARMGFLSALRRIVTHGK